jgi:hypothetical protein
MAACLKSVRYNIDLWNGEHEKPVGYRSLVLVTGGSSETISWIDGDHLQSITIDPVAHYRSQTVGAMLWNAFYHGCELLVEVLQTNFREIQDKVDVDLHLAVVHGHCS